MFGTSASWVTGAKSLTGSNGSFECSAGLMTWLGLTRIIV